MPRKGEFGNRKCSVPECDRKHRARGLCQAHWTQFKDNAPDRPKCSVEGCVTNIRARGFCFKHYQNFRKHGDPEGGLKRAKPEETTDFLINKVLTYDGDECLFWPFNKGYAKYRIDGKLISLTRWICEEANGPPAGDFTEVHAAHSCGKGHLGCVTLKHLRWATVSENSEDKRLHGTMLLGEQVAQSKLTSDQVISIRKRASAGEVQNRLAEEYGVGATQISRIVRRERWEWLP